jgi:hypothetical protein
VWIQHIFWYSVLCSRVMFAGGSRCVEVDVFRELPGQAAAAHHLVWVAAGASVLCGAGALCLQG